MRPESITRNSRAPQSVNRDKFLGVPFAKIIRSTLEWGGSGRATRKDITMDFDSLPRIPPEPRRRAGGWLLLLVLVVIYAVLAPAVHWATEWLWYREVARTDVYWTMFWGRWLLGGAVGAVFFVLVFTNVFLALRETPELTWTDLGTQLRQHLFDVVNRTLRRLAYWGSAAVTFLFALLIGRSAADYWPQFLLFAHAQSLGSVDPLFHRDIGFYLFRLPVWELLSSWLFTSVLLAFILTTIFYFSTHAFRMVAGLPVMSRPVKVHLYLLLALLFLLKACGYYLDRFKLLYAQSNLFVGAGYTDVHARLPGLTVLMVLAVIAALYLLINIARRSNLAPVFAVGGMIAASILALDFYPSVVQRVQVSPNELAMETPYLANNINLTRQAYGLDKVRAVPFSPTPRVTKAMLDASPDTVKNIRLWDHRPLLESYRQGQTLRTYYQMNDVDIDRYQINGKLRQVMLSARELNVDQIPGQQSWVNRHLIYTHGYGLVMSPVNEFDPDKGEPVYYINDIPPVSTIPTLKVTRPAIYYGESTGDYAVVRTSQPEFDYPLSEAKNATTTYEGTAGIPLKNPLVRALMASRFGSLDLLISNTITANSRLLMRRNILERAQALAPFLAFDRDPYVVLGDDGHLYWMLDAYTRSIRYPYAGYADLDTANDESTQTNYLRNPVKVVVDAYSGTTTFYTVTPDEPFIRAWSSVFPALFHPLAEMPAGLRRHIRVPEGMFDTISEVYRRYHMTDPTTFYQQEDLWDIPNESSELNDNGQPITARMEAYYTAMSLPGSKETEYLLIRPYTSAGKKNMIAWLCARNDPGHFGEMMVYDFPKKNFINGPELIESQINQTPEISQAFTLWNTSGSRVWLGNLLVIPIADSILYVQPVYLKAQQSQFPELQRVIVADQDRVIMRRTLDEALAELSGGAVAAAPTTPAATTPTTPSPPARSGASTPLARSALAHYHTAIEALKKGDWATYGHELDAMRKDLEEMNK